MNEKKEMEEIIKQEKKKKKSLIKQIIWVVSIYVALAGTIGFTCFIFEEAMQLQSFACFMYQETNDWEGMERHIKGMEKTQLTATAFVYGVGWINPIMYPAFKEYLNSNEDYIKAAKRRVKRECLYCDASGCVERCL